ncbi:DUF5715 family protein [Edaphobacter modestus]|uniref:D-alanyl-D-alanine carboxypeptidase-like protein n=1 Tax=Edaphobacter modestus TaxID=388466 RepID=A0A4Q7YW37_9BACT|nr:DUF5715 family protein [Edaphobacter modestus]RZU42122.1 hypothetical protein BDD14_3668 [Edaphobacter modestus]
MRRNAFITALLALASLSPVPTAFAATARKTHRAAVHPTSTAKAKVVASKRPVSKKTSTHKKPTTAASHSPTAELVHSTDSPRKHTTRSRQSAAAESPDGHRKATSDDFLKAAQASPKTVATSEPKSGARRHKVRTTIVDKNTKTESVVSVTRAQAPRKSEAESVADEAATPIILPTIYNKRGRLIVPRPLKGSHEILVRQNVVADRDGLDRIQDDNDLLRMREQHLLVALPVSRALEVDDRLPSDRRFSRPWTAQFLATLAQAHYARFHTPIQVNSAVRTVEFQQRLLRTNGNAAPAEGETASPHLTGQAVDIAKHGLSRTEIAWLRGYLLPLIQQGRIDVEEEFQQACFHISVYKKYVPSERAPRREIADHHSSTTALAAAVQ